MKTLNTNYIVIEYDQDKEDETKRFRTSGCCSGTDTKIP